MMLAILIFMGTAVALALLLIAASVRSSREEARELAAAREREQRARQDAERARALRARWEARIAEDQLAAALADPRGIGDGLGRDHDPARRTGRFRRDNAPAPLHSASDRG